MPLIVPIILIAVIVAACFAVWWFLPGLMFTYPWVLAALVVPAGLLAWTVLRRGQRVVLPFDHGVGSSGRRWAALVGLFECVPALVLAVVIVILAGPQQLGQPKSKRAMTNIQFCVDISGSMTAPFGDGSRYDASMKEIDRFLDFRKGDAFGLTFFGNNYLHWVPITSDASAIRCSIPFMRPESAPPGFGGTEIGKALIACKKQLQQQDTGDKMIILVSDGYSADLGGDSENRITKQLADAGIVVYAIHIAESEIPDPIINIAANTGGEAFGTDDPGSLEAVFGKIDSMQQAEFTKVAADTLDNFAPWSVAGLSLLGFALIGLFGLRYTPW